MGRAVAVVLLPSAGTDLREAREHYREISEDLADAFAEAFEQVVERLELFPRSGTPVGASQACAEPGCATSPTASSIASSTRTTCAFCECSTIDATGRPRSPRRRPKVMTPTR